MHGCTTGMHLDKILELLAKQMGNAASEEELAELEHLLQQYPNHQPLVAILQSIQSKKLKQPAQNEDLVVKEGWEKLQQKLHEIKTVAPEPAITPVGRKLFARTMKWTAAAALIGLVLLAVLLYQKTTKNSPVNPGANTFATLQEAVPHGKPEKKTLPDGSIVWINAGSKISYTTEQNIRSVHLEGQAYFIVHHDAGHPFIVHAGNIAVKALGTEFNVLAYPGEDHVEATLIKGKVQVTMEEKPDQKIILSPYEKFTIVNQRIAVKNKVPRNEISYEVKPVKVLPALNEVTEVAWMQDKLAFQNEPFFILAKKMERRYDVHIVFQNEAIKKETLSGIFENENIQKAMRVLQMTTPFQYRMRGDSIFIDRP